MTSRLLTDPMLLRSVVGSEAALLDKRGPGAAIPLDVVSWLALECERQRSGERSVSWMARAWLYALGRARGRAAGRHGVGQGPSEITLPHVLTLGSLVEPQKNALGVRRVRVWVGRDEKLAPERVAVALEELLACQGGLSPEEFYARYEDVHPFEDGNGRTGSLLYNWLRGTLDAPEHPPDWDDPAGYWSRRRRDLADDTFGT